jgi:K-box region
MIYEMARMKEENDKLEVFIRRYLGKDLTSLTMNDMNHLEKQLESSLDKVRNRKVNSSFAFLNHTEFVFYIA